MGRDCRGVEGTGKVGEEDMAGLCEGREVIVGTDKEVVVAGEEELGRVVVVREVTGEVLEVTVIEGCEDTSDVEESGVEVEGVEEVIGGGGRLWVGGWMGA